MAEPVRNENSDDRVIIRKGTDTFLENVITNGYAELRYDKASDVLESAGATFTQGLAKPNPYLTGALTPVLPLQISLSDKDNNRITFTLLVNPTNLNHSKTSSVNSSYTRNGFITQLWGANQDLITSTGKTAAFMVEGTGLTNVARRRSFAYVNFLALLYSYRNNGYQFLDPTFLRNTLTRVINTVHGVELSYDNQLYMGHFNNFAIDESADRSYLFEYNFEFVVSSLSNDYGEVKGHFIPIKDVKTAPDKPKLISNVTESSDISGAINTYGGR